MKKIILTSLICLAIVGCKDEKKASENETAATEERTQETAMEGNDSPADFEITPISHATAVFSWDDTIFYIDPVGGAAAFEGQPAPDVILITDIHGDHMNQETVEAVAKESTKIIVPKAVANGMDMDKNRLTILNNGQTKMISGFSIEGIPMYNLREEAKQFHEKGRGNGYVIEKGNTRVYFSGDTEDIPEMRNLKNIDMAFVCMNLPYTMTVESAADAVLDFKPKKVYPYHFRGQGGMSDVDKFEQLVNEGDADIEVVRLDWYPETE